MRLAVVGLGFMGRTHLKALENISSVQLGRTVTQTDDFFAALDDSAIDALDLCLPTDLHESFTIEALRRGKHVLVEKPMALSADACRRMIDEARHAGRVLMVAQVLRFFPAYMTLETSLKETGEVRAATFRRRCGRPKWSSWLSNPARSGGAVLDLLVHDFDMALHLFGPPRAVSATGVQQGENDQISARLHYENGFCVTIDGGWLAGDVPFSMEYTVATDRGTFDYHSQSRPPSLWPLHGEPRDLELTTEDPYASEIAYFADCVRDGREPARCPPQESAAAVKLALALTEARKWNGEKIPWTSA